MSKEMYKLNDHDFVALAKEERNPTVSTRFYILNMYKLGKSSKEIAQALSINAETARRARRRFFQGGVEGLKAKPRLGRKSKLAAQDIESFKALIIEEQSKRGGGRLIAKDIRQLVKEHYQVDYSLSGIYDLLKRIGMS